MATTAKHIADLNKLAIDLKKKFEHEGQQLVREALALKRHMADSFHVMGHILKRLKDRRIALALGFKGFGALCKKKLGLSIDQANRLIAIADHYSPSFAKKLGRTKAAAILELIRALDSKQSPLAFCRRGIVALGPHLPSMFIQLL